MGLAKHFDFMNNTIEYDRMAYKKYMIHCYAERAALVEKGCDVDFQMISFEEFMERIEKDSEFAKVWGYWNFI